VSNLDDLDRLFAQIRKEKGNIDIVFANAGVARYAPLGQSLKIFSIRSFDITLKASYSRSEIAFASAAMADRSS